MVDLILGEYDVRRDDRGRLRLPAEIVQRHAEDGDGHFVLRKGMDDCLVLYPMSAWRRESARVNALDDMVAKERKFKRMFFTTSKAVALDGNSRIQMPAFLTERAGIDRDVVIVGIGDRYEIWDRTKHLAEAEDYEQLNELAGEIFGRRDAHPDA